MKKLMIAAAIVCAAAFANAASIKWGGDIAKPDGETAVGAGSVAYLVHGATAADVAISTIFVGGTDWKNWTTNIEGTSIVSAYTLSDAEALTNYRFEAQQAIKGEADLGFYSLVVVDGGAGANGLTGAYAYLGENTVGSPVGTDVDLLIGDGWASGTAPFIGQDGYDAVSFTSAVPEPTTGLLMLLGMGALALRRRRA